jgi:hypothetical protein
MITPDFMITEGGARAGPVGVDGVALPWCTALVYGTCVRIRQVLLLGCRGEAL